MKYAKNVYKNRPINSHLDDLLRVACSYYKLDTPKIVKNNYLNIKIHTD